LIADLTRWWGWPPDAAWNMTGSRLMWWLEQQHRIAEREESARGTNR
jgi:hypothetical protein